MITVIGSLNMDMVTYAERMPNPGETIMGDSFRQVPGGKGANQADAAAKLGAHVAMVGCVGNDDIGIALRTALKKDGADVSHVAAIEGVSTGVAVIVVDHEGQNCIVVVPGANYKLSEEQVAASHKVIEDADILVAQLEVPRESIGAAFKLAKSLGKTTILNPAPAMTLEADILANTDLLIPNDHELKILSGMDISSEERIVQAARILIAQGVGAVIVTLGEKGCMYVSKDISKTYRAYKVKAVDTTAAGDSFIGAIATALDEGKTIEEAIPFAMAVGALTVTKKGAQSSLPYRSEVNVFIKAEVE